MGGRISEPKHSAANAEGEKNMLKEEMLGIRETEAKKRTLEALSPICSTHHLPLLTISLIKRITGERVGGCRANI